MHYRFSAAPGLSMGMRLTVLMVLMVLTVLLTGCGAEGMIVGKRAEPVTADLFALDTWCSISIYEGGEEALSKGTAALREAEALFDFNREGSDLYRINHRESSQVEISEKTEEMLRTGLLVCRLSEGALEPTIRPLTNLWDFKGKKKAPEKERVLEALTHIHPLGFSVENGLFESEFEDLTVDVGAFAKGFAADMVAEALRENGVTSAIINLGGNVLCIGKRPEGKPFRIGLRKPALAEKGREEKCLAVAGIEDMSVVTAGIYERYFIEDGVFYHHILDPATGYPADNGLAAVTVIGENSALCDALSTSLMILGEEKGRKLMEKINTGEGTGYGACFIYRDETLSCTPEAEKYISAP